MDKLNCTFFLNLIAIKAEIIRLQQIFVSSQSFGFLLEYECAYHIMNYILQLC